MLKFTLKFTLSLVTFLPMRSNVLVVVSIQVRLFIIEGVFVCCVNLECGRDLVRCSYHQMVFNYCREHRKHRFLGNRICAERSTTAQCEGCRYVKFGSEPHTNRILPVHREIEDEVAAVAEHAVDVRVIAIRKRQRHFVEGALPVHPFKIHSDTGKPLSSEPMHQMQPTEGILALSQDRSWQ